VGRFIVVLIILSVSAVGLFADVSGDWEQVETEHFLIVYRHPDRVYVDELLTFCEDVYVKITDFFKSYPRKITVVILDKVDYANGWMTALPLRIDLILTAPHDTGLITPSEDWLKLVFTHEFTHYVHLSMHEGLFNVLSWVLGPEVALGGSFFIPGWMLEGITTNTETIFTTGGRGRSAFFEMQYKAPVMEGSLFNFDQAAYGSNFPPYGRIYVAGYILVDHILRAYGRDAFTRIMEKYLAFPFFGPWAAIQEVTGKSGQEVFADLKKSLEERYRADKNIPSGFLLSPDRIGSFTHPQPTAKGLYIYKSDMERFPAIERLDILDKTEAEILPVALTDSSSFSAAADGRRIYFTTMDFDYRDYTQEEAISDLYALDADTGKERRITTGAHLRHPAVSPDGTRLVAVQQVQSYSRLVSVDPDTGGLEILFSRAQSNVYNPSFSPDAGLLTFILDVRGFQDVYVLDTDEAAGGAVPETDPRAYVTDVNAGLARAVLGPDIHEEFFPVFIDDHRLLFSSDRSGSLSLYIADLSGAVHELLKDPVGAYCGVAVEDTLIYGSYSSKGSCLKTIALPDASSSAALSSETQPYPAAPEWTGSSVPSSPYIDLPRFCFWTPFPLPAVTGPAGWEFGVGAFTLWASPLQTSMIAAFLGYLPASGHPVANLSLDVHLGCVGLAYTGGLGYTYAGDASGGVFAQSISNALTASVQLVSHYAFQYFHSLIVSAGVIHGMSMAHSSAFGFFDSFSPAYSWGSSLSVSAGINYGFSASGGTLDLYSPLDVSLSANNALVPPILSITQWGDLATLVMSINVPSLAPHHVIRFGTKTSYGFGAGANRMDGTAAPRGFTDPQAGGAAGRTLASVDYLATLGLYDFPLILGFSFQGIAGGLHVEGLGQWDPVTGAFGLLPSLYVGAEISVLLGLSGWGFPPFGAGVSARIDVGNPAAFDVTRDIGFYIYLTVDSFWNTVFPMDPDHNPLEGIRFP
jgi:hypothetical protein